MDTNVAGSVEITVESDQSLQLSGTLCLSMLGPMAVSRAGVALEFPASRKVRALIAYLAMAPKAVARRDLCELLWDVPDDPRGELRWSLSKARRILDEPESRRVTSCGDAIRLDLSTCFVDAIEISRAVQEGIEALPLERLRTLSALMGGDFLDGLEIDRAPYFQAWLIAQRRRFRSCHIALLEQLVGRSGESEEALGQMAQWLELAPFDLRAHATLLDALARRGRFPEGEEHLAATVRLFEAEGLECKPIRDVWQAARGRCKSGPLRAQAISCSVTPLSINRGDVAASNTPRRATIAVMPFVDHTLGGVSQRRFADGLVHDVITRLAKLRSLFVIAQGTVFALGERNIGPEEAGRLLSADYVVSGTLRRQGTRITVMVELAETRTARIVWAEVFDNKLDNAFLVLDEIGDRIVASIASEIETAERNRAILKPPNSLDAWESYHRGLWHMYRFNRADNDVAQGFFEMAVRLDPTFARAYAGLSFTHFQNVFQGWTERNQEIDRAFETAGQSLIVDDRDPAAHWAMGRALWLRGQLDQSVLELDRAVDLSPNFALGHYTLAFVHCQSGDPLAAIRSTDRSRHLSPFDPLQFAMLAARAMALVRLGQFEEAANWAVKAAGRPNAHVHILAIAANCLALAGRLEEARAFVVSLHEALPDYRFDNFLSAFRFSPDAASAYRQGAERIGLA